MRLAVKGNPIAELAYAGWRAQGYDVRIYLDDVLVDMVVEVDDVEGWVRMYDGTSNSTEFNAVVKHGKVRIELYERKNAGSQ